MNAKYDGILGSPPDWFPQHVGRGFLIARENLFNCGYGIKEIRKWVNKMYRFHTKGIQVWPSPIPQHIFNEVNTLAVYKACHSLGKIEGLKKLCPEVATRYAGLATGYKRGAERTKENADTRKREIYKAAVYFFSQKENLLKNADDFISCARLQPSLFALLAYSRGKKISDDRIKKYIVGAKEEGRKKLSSS